MKEIRNLALTLLWFIVLLIICCLFGCKTTKKTTTEEHQQHITTIKVDSSYIDSIVRYNVEKHLSTTIVLNGEWSRIIYSTPDSTGKQYIKEEIKGKFNKQEHTQAEEIDTSKFFVRHNVNNIELSELNASDTIQATKTTSAKTWYGRVAWIMIVLVFIVLILAAAKKYSS